MKKKKFQAVEYENFEEQTLADYAAKSKNSLGRIYPEEKHSYRTCYQRDRDRIMYCAAFRRLEDKTQVFFDLKNNYFRTRLTHTLEVAQTARVIAQSLRLNTDLAEAIALAHDIGHPPFGHQGEELLNELVLENSENIGSDFVGFEHNLQGLRIVDFLEQRYPHFDGLNLTHEVRRGIAKYPVCFAGEENRFCEFLQTPKTVEAIVVDFSDKISYMAHDLEDALVAGVMSIEIAEAQPLMQQVMEFSKVKYSNLPRIKRIYLLCRDFKNFVVTEFINESIERVSNFTPEKLLHPSDLLGFPEKIDENSINFYDFLYNYFYTDQTFKSVIHQNSKAIKDLFVYYLKNENMMPVDFHNRSKVRHVCDYLAMQTDRSILSIHERITL